MRQTLMECDLQATTLDDDGGGNSGDGGEDGGSGGVSKVLWQRAGIRVWRQIQHGAFIATF